MLRRRLVLAGLAVAGTVAGTLPASAYWYYGPRFYGPPVYGYPPPFFYRPPVAFVPPPYYPPAYYRPPAIYPAYRPRLVMRRVLRPVRPVVPATSPFAGPGREEGITPATLTTKPPTPAAPPPVAPAVGAPPAIAAPPVTAAPNHDVYPPETFGD